MTGEQGVVAVILRGERFLVIRRSELVRAPGCYCFPGGGIHAGEDEPTALIRELREELNVGIQPVRSLWNSVTPWGVSLSWWHAVLPDNIEPQPNPAEVAAVHWLLADELLALSELLASNRDFLAVHSAASIRQAIPDAQLGRNSTRGCHCWLASSEIGGDGFDWR